MTNEICSPIKYHLVQKIEVLCCDIYLPYCDLAAQRVNQFGWFALLMNDLLDSSV